MNKWGDYLVAYHALIKDTREYNADDWFKFITWYMEAGKN